ncbi:NERD domain-containing protein [Paraburkholderia sp. UCT31]|uniref:nuclease-related domain-containing protein n=1 Tax=Paraburkholderia sp. UCT31 TaxID=2615209 RepID=UPI001655D1F8|nr:nuclease-related domain-containing protein [Paraburkholderia sp. UCT31]MBC8738499.1 NERD domain-containing protein [Paraburkholderia sp. UCT31]
MIVKELDVFPGGDIYEVAGRKAEENMAYYLRRRFADDSEVLVLNGLRLEHEGEVAQIDHLVVYEHGFFIIESKSVTTQIRVNELDEWSRMVDGVWRGMPSPIAQARLQYLVLVKKLDVRSNDFLGKLWNIAQKNFRAYFREVVVAISDSGIVERPPGNAFPNVLKADQVCEYIRTKIAEHATAHTARSILFRAQDKIAMKFSADEMLKAVAYLQKSHTPRVQKAALDNAAPLQSEVILLPSEVPPARQESQTNQYYCAQCRGHVGIGVAKFCWGNRARFGGRVYCMDCQKRV